MQYGGNLNLKKNWSYPIRFEPASDTKCLRYSSALSREKSFALKTHLFYCPCAVNNCEWKIDCECVDVSDVFIWSGRIAQKDIKKANAILFEQNYIIPNQVACSCRLKEMPKI